MTTKHPDYLEDLEYHKWCKAICQSCGWTIHGSTKQSGCSMYPTQHSNHPVDIPHFVLVELDRRGSNQ